jgi:hypothetical protein
MNNYYDPLEKTKFYQPKNVLNHPNYYKIEENIHVIKNFTTEKERKYYLNVVKNSTKYDWNKDPREWWNNKILFIGEKRILDYQNINILNRIKKLFNDYNEQDIYFSQIGNINRMQPGEKMFSHSDNPCGSEIDYGIKGVTNYVIFGMTLYHSQFNGGEIFYDNLNISYKPNAGDLLIHPGSLKYTHSTLPVLPGENRYISTVFLYDKKAKKLKENNFVFENIIDQKVEKTQDPIKKYHI